MLARTDGPSQPYAPAMEQEYHEKPLGIGDSLSVFLSTQLVSDVKR
jgi:hypothetical protein